MTRQTEFQGTSRFQILRKLGQGGMGVVYEALDRERRLRVALKTLHHQLNPVALYHFKQEFRSIAGIVHPNLISLYELFAEGEVWFFTMEFVEGIEFARSVRATTSSSGSFAAPTPASEPLLLSSDGPTLTHADAPTVHGITSASSIFQRDEPGNPDRIRELLRQVAEGLLAVHTAGKLHRDIKSSNVLVTPDGRAVLLDFGLAAGFEEAGRMHIPGEVVGTILFMSPEQGAGQPLAPAGDWYSLGVMLYQALTGCMPFSGTAAEVLRQKREGEPPPPRTIVPIVPEDLDLLCCDLLRTRPEDRPVGAEVLERLEDFAGRALAPLLPAPRRARGSAPVFVGRETEEKQLLEAFATAREGAAVVALVRGPSGLGKSSLVSHFLGRPELAEVLVLRGRCYEQESVPYKALDSAMDALSRYLRRLPPKQLAPLLPDDLGPLMQVFPVLQQVQPRFRSPAIRQESADPQAVRRRAFRAFRELFARARRHQPVVLYLDDLQWGDTDSVFLLAELLAPPDPPPVLVVCSFRSEHAERSPFLETLSAVREKGGAKFFDVAVEPLDPGAASALAAKLMGATGPASEERARLIAQESGGNPYFLLELAQCSAEECSNASGKTSPATLDEILWRRISNLPQPAQRLLQIISVSGQPLAQADAYRAAGFENRDPAPFSALRYGNLIRTSGSHGLDQVESFHDRIREVVVGRLEQERRRVLHGDLATTLEDSGRTDAETLAFHFEHAGGLAKASAYYEMAAEHSGEALAFDRSAQLFERALGLGEHPAEKRRALQVRLAEAFANGGRGVRAAEEYERAAGAADAAQRLELERHAAYHYCSSGHLEEGLEISRRVLNRVGLKLSRNRRVTVFKVLWHSARLHLRGVRFRAREIKEIPPKLLNRFDAAWAMAAPMAQADLLEALNFGTLCLLLGLSAGDPIRLVRATLVGAYLMSVQGRSGRRLAEKLVKTSRVHAEQLGDPRLRAYVALSQMGISYMCAEWRNCCHHALEAEAILTRECPGTRWEVSSLWTLYLYSLSSLGRFAELARRTGPLLEDADDRGDLYSFVNLKVFCEPNVLLAADRPAEARESIRSGLARWTSREFDLQHAMAAHARIWVDLYEGRAAGSLESARHTWELVRKNHFSAHPNVRANWLDDVGRCALAVAASSRSSRGERAEALHLARRIARQLAADRFSWAKATAPAIEAGVLAVEGNSAKAAEALLEAARRFDLYDMSSFAAAARRYAGKLLGGEQGRLLVARADEWMQSQGIVRPDRMAACHIGGYLD